MKAQNKIPFLQNTRNFSKAAMNSQDIFRVVKARNSENFKSPIMSRNTFKNMEESYQFASNSSVFNPKNDLWKIKLKDQTKALNKELEYHRKESLSTPKFQTTKD